MLQGLTTSTDRIWDLVRTLPKNFRVLVPSAIFQLNHVNFIILEEKTFPCCLITSSSSDTNSQVLGRSFHLIREAPTKMLPLLFGHCPNCDCTPPPALKRALWGTLFSNQFEQLCQITVLMVISAPKHPGKPSHPP